jgi:predicted RNA-binding protein with PIN domain
VFLIDGYNLLHVLTRGRAGDEARRQLVSLVQAFCARGNYRARIVFDPTGGMRRRDQQGEVEILSVAQGRTADDEILAAIGSTDDRTRYTVVSNDLAIVKAAEKKRMEVLPCEEFAKRLAERPEGSDKGAVPPGDVDYWMREFGLEDP